MGTFDDSKDQRKGMIIFMKALEHWNYHPYTSPIDNSKKENPYICRIVPGKEKFAFDWFDTSFSGEHTVSYRKRQSLEPEITLPLVDSYMEITDLEDEQDYEFVIHRVGKKGKSTKRLVRTGFVPGVVINYLHPLDEAYKMSGRFLGCPSITQLPSGDLLSSMHVFGKGGNLLMLFKSKDNGQTWRYVTDLCPAFWAKLFVHNEDLYCLCVDEPYGNLQIGKSTDEGETWSLPVKLFAKCDLFANGGIHKSAVPVVQHDGRIWSAIEYGIKENGLAYRRMGLISAPQDSDLLNPSNWRCTEFVPYDKSWPDTPEAFHVDCIEGNAVVAPDGCICDFIRLEVFYTNKPVYNKACIMRSDNNDPEKPLKFDRIVDIPVGIRHKFLIQKDPKTGKYITLGNENGEDMPQRTVLTMSVSDDFYHWRVAKRLIDYRQADPQYVGFQYPDWIFHGEDIYFVSRTGFNQSDSFHNSNFTTFHVVKNYQKYL